MPCEPCASFVRHSHPACNCWASRFPYRSSLKAVLLSASTVDPRRPHFAQFLCNVSPFGINTSKSVLKQTPLTPFKMNTYEKSAGWGRVHSLLPPIVRAARAKRLKSFHFMQLRTLLHPAKNQLFCFQAIPHSFAKTPGVGCSSAQCSPQPAFAPTNLEPQILFFQSTLSFPQ